MLIRQDLGVTLAGCASGATVSWSRQMSTESTDESNSADQQFDYDVFISYRTSMHPDREIAMELQKVLENYPIPGRYKSQLVAPRIWRHRLKVFRDTTDLPASANLSEELRERLRRSRYLIVVCTPNTPLSPYCAEEIRQFRKFHGNSRILALLAKGEPHEAFPAALLTTTSEADVVEPLAADVRAADEKSVLRRLRGRAEPKVHQARFKLISAVLGLNSPDELVRRHEKKFRNQLWVAGCIAVLVAALIEMSWREIRGEQQARSLVAKLLAGSEQEVSQMLPELNGIRRWAGDLLRQELQRETPPETAGQFDHFARQSNAVVAVVRLGDPDRLRSCLNSSDPSQTSVVVERYAPSGGDLDALIRLLDRESEPRVRRNLVLILGGFAPERLADSLVVRQLLGIYQNDPDPGVHSASAWVLESLRRKNLLSAEALQRWREVDRELATGRPMNDRRWYKLKRAIQTMTVVRDGHYWYGEPPAKRRFDRAFAISSTEVTIEHILPFLVSVGRTTLYDRKIGDSQDCPMNSISWFLAAEFCNWLSEQEGVPREQWCYEPNPDGNFDDGMRFHPQRTGYRLPTDDEWECACRAGTRTTYGFGDVVQLLPAYVWCLPASKNPAVTLPVGSLKPNAFGLFDMHGNVQEWCQSEYKLSPDGGVVVYRTSDRTLRGGSFRFDAENCDSADRTGYYPINRDADIGFRIARSLP